MSAGSARFFSWIQGAAFYEDAHRSAVNFVPPGEGARWLDVGTGPGLVARLAAEHGYDALGIDIDPAMIDLANRGRTGRGSLNFAVGSLEAVTANGRTAAVVSAASLLIGLADPVSAIRTLWSWVEPGGRLVIIETTDAMTPANARAYRSSVPRGRRVALAMWARARDGRAVDPRVFDAVRAVKRDEHLLLGGMLRVTMLRSAGTPPGEPAGR